MTGINKRSSHPGKGQKKLSERTHPASNYTQPTIVHSHREIIDGKMETLTVANRDVQEDEKRRRRSIKGHGRATAKAKAEINRRKKK